jgi:hypothetical protein
MGTEVPASQLQDFRLVIGFERHRRKWEASIHSGSALWIEHLGDRDQARLVPIARRDIIGLMKRQVAHTGSSLRSTAHDRQPAAGNSFMALIRREGGLSSRTGAGQPLDRRLAESDGAVT